MQFMRCYKIYAAHANIQMNPHKPNRMANSSVDATCQQAGRLRQKQLELESGDDNFLCILVFCLLWTIFRKHEASKS